MLYILDMLLSYYVAILDFLSNCPPSGANLFYVIFAVIPAITLNYGTLVLPPSPPPIDQWNQGIYWTIPAKQVL